MSSPHGDLGPELRRLAQALLDRLDPTLQAMASAAVQGRGGAGPCQQVWCPVCALAALISGEQHPLLTVVADHSVSLMAVISAMVADAQRMGNTHAAQGDQSDQADEAGQADEADRKTSSSAAGTPPPPTDPDAAPPAPGTRAGNGSGTRAGNGSGNGAGGYQHIPIVVEPVPAED
ncbi:MAG TPA: hypothetical protein PLD01_04250 [Mycobacterium sp.]|nr:hypothetical protein [Mycobacterium sp.]HQE14274.1 hypothetical protein [Mycobacterium sp.]